MKKLNLLNANNQRLDFSCGFPIKARRFRKSFFLFPWRRFSHRLLTYPKIAILWDGLNLQTGMEEMDRMISGTGRNPLFTVIFLTLFNVWLMACNSGESPAPASTATPKATTTDSTAQEAAEPPALEPAMETPALAGEAGASKPKFGISAPGAVSELVLKPGEPLHVKGWWVGNEPQAMTYVFNGQTADATPDERADVRKNHPEYQYAEGWRIGIPSVELQPVNTLEIRMGGKKIWSMTVSVDQSSPTP